MAIKTCKDCSADVKEKFLSEAGECVAVAEIISFQSTCTCTSQTHIQVTGLVRRFVMQLQSLTDVHNRKCNVFPQLVRRKITFCCRIFLT